MSSAPSAFWITETKTGVKCLFVLGDAPSAWSSCANAPVLVQPSEPLSLPEHVMNREAASRGMCECCPAWQQRMAAALAHLDPEDCTGYASVFIVDKNNTLNADLLRMLKPPWMNSMVSALAIAQFRLRDSTFAWSLLAPSYAVCIPYHAMHEDEMARGGYAKDAIETFLMSCTRCRKVGSTVEWECVNLRPTAALRDDRKGFTKESNGIPKTTTRVAPTSLTLTLPSELAPTLLPESESNTSSLSERTASSTWKAKRNRRGETVTNKPTPQGVTDE